MHVPSLPPAVQHVLHCYSPVCLGSQCGPGVTALLASRKERHCVLGMSKAQGLQLSLPEIFDWAISLTEISPLAPAM